MIGDGKHTFPLLNHKSLSLVGIQQPEKFKPTGAERPTTLRPVVVESYIKGVL